ncbi:DUF1640-domain-containing protein [Lindgomyces ingoldianus]|uniref:DUF1640-domain-containing protein n=1 Tax=Lindgomyces ingoldianus TaxID=673940 RepID=A0ACB6R894_9PLEO|nr:DUF1640-domain-containing protein [Lindgomyces ingoldianus]KAF2474545.1 DUF1640-domain-containing protein [Lindgomyces ingoldianus]
MQTPAIPRFLLPRLTWSRRVLHPTGVRSLLEANRRRAPPPATQQFTRAQSTFTTKTVPFIILHRCPRLQILSSLGLPVFEFRRSFTATAAPARDHHFDTLKCVQRLKDEGFTEEQGEAVMRVLSDVIEESIQNLTRTMVLREDQEKAAYTQKVDFAKLRSELMTADSTESSLTRASHERLTNELAKLNSRLRDEIQRTQASVRLDLNLEKGRIREEANVQELKIKETETRIEQETAQLRERLEAVKFSTLQWLMGVCTGTAALMLGVWRLLM